MLLFVALIAFAVMILTGFVRVANIRYRQRRRNLLPAEIAALDSELAEELRIF